MQNVVSRALLGAAAPSCTSSVTNVAGELRESAVSCQRATTPCWLRGQRGDAAVDVLIVAVDGVDRAEATSCTDAMHDIARVWQGRLGATLVTGWRGRLGATPGAAGAPPNGQHGASPHVERLASREVAQVGGGDGRCGG